MLDAFGMVEGYCNLLIERVHLIEQEKMCPDELKEAISTLLYAASRCGEFPELQEIRGLFTSHYGKEFVGRAIELRNNCGVNPKMIQKLSTRPPDLENRIKVLEEIAAESGIPLQLHEGSSASTENLSSVAHSKPEDSSETSPREMRKEDGLSDSVKARKKYKDVADAAQAAFESAAYAAEAARAAVELSRTGSHDPGDHDSPSNHQRKVIDGQQPVNIVSRSKNQEIHGEIQAESSKKSKNIAELERAMSTSNSDSTEENLNVPTMSFDEVDPIKLLEKDTVFYDSDKEDVGSSLKQIPSSSKAVLKVKSGQPAADAAKGSEFQSKQHLDMVKGPISVRTRQVRGY